jgi:type I restriction enzyme, S subunit
VTKASEVGVPASWIAVRLDSIAEVRLGRQRSPARAVGDHMRPYLRAANVTWNGLNLSDVKEMDFRPSEQQIYELRAGDILLAEASGSANEVGKPAVWNGEIEGCCFQNTLLRVRVPLELTKYLYYHFLADASLGRFGQRARGVGIHHLGAEGLSTWTVRIAPLAEQRRIVAAIETQFTRLDAAVAALRRARANLKRYRAAVLKAAVEGRLVPTEAELARAEGREYESGERLAERLAAIIGGGQRLLMASSNEHASSPLPKGWAHIRLGIALTFLRNGLSRRPDASKGTRILRISAVRPLSVNLDDVRFLSGEPEDYAEYLLESGDLLFTRYNGNPDLVGVCGVVQSVSQPTAHPDKLIRAKVPTQLASPDFLQIALNVGVSRAFIRQRVRTTAGQSGISGGDLRSVPVPLAPFAEQVRIAAEVDRRWSLLDELEVAIDHGLKRAERLRQAILKRAFEGKLVPQDPNDEPAGVLLERIRAERTASATGPAPRRGAARRPRRGADVPAGAPRLF